jgi:hypothetical protein
LTFVRDSSDDFSAVTSAQPGRGVAVVVGVLAGLVVAVEPVV